jgi:hypothetical protein
VPRGAGDDDVTDAPALDELPSLIDEGLRIVDERLAIDPDSQIYDSLKAQLAYVRQVVRGEQPRDAADDDRLLLNRYAAHEFEASDPPFADVLFKVHYLYERWPKPATTVPQRAGSRSTKSPPGWPVVIIAFVAGAVIVGSGVFLLIQRQTGTLATATVGDCQVTGAGRYRSVHCTGSWIVGGSLLAGGHVVVGTVDGVDTDAVGKTIDVTLRGDTAYSRGLTLPLLLIGLGLVPAVAAALAARRLFRPLPERRAPLPG